MLRRLCVLGSLPLFLLLVASPARADEKKTQGLELQEVVKLIDVVLDLKWRPVLVKGYALGKESRFDITWQTVDEKGNWYIYLDMTAAGFARRIEELNEKGFKVVMKHTWKVDGEERIGAIWYPK